MAQIIFSDGVRATPENWQQRVNDVLASNKNRKPRKVRAGERVTYYTPDIILPLADPDNMPWAGTTGGDPNEVQE